MDDVGWEGHVPYAFGNAIAEHALDRGVDPQQLAVGRQPELEVVGVVGDGMKAGLVFAGAVDVETHRLGHAVERVDQLADLVFACIGQLDVHVALRHAFAGTGQRFEAANHAADRQGQQDASQQQGACGNEQALAEVAAARLLDEVTRQYQGNFAISLA